MSCEHATPAGPGICLECMEKIQAEHRAKMEAALENLVTCIVSGDRDELAAAWRDVNSKLIAGAFILGIKGMIEKGECLCGGPLGHVPNGVNCRRAL